MIGQSQKGCSLLKLKGCKTFVGWLSTLPGYNDRELARAMGCTKVARFIVFKAKR